MTITHAATATPAPPLHQTRQCVCGGWTRYIVCQYCGTTDPAAAAAGLVSITPLVQRMPEDVDGGGHAEAAAALAEVQGEWSTGYAVDPAPWAEPSAFAEQPPVAAPVLHPLAAPADVQASAPAALPVALVAPAFVGAGVQPAFAPAQPATVPAELAPLPVESLPVEALPAPLPARLGAAGWAAAPPSADHALAEPEAPALDEPAHGRARPRWLVPALGAALLAAVGGGYLLLGGGGDGSDPTFTPPARPAAAAPNKAAPAAPAAVPAAADPAADTQAQALVRNVALLEETWATDHGGAYTASVDDLSTLGLTSSPQVTALKVGTSGAGVAGSFTVRASSTSGQAFCFDSAKAGAGVSPC